MNERIKELEKLATPRCYDETGCYIGNRFDVEKFAELIIEEWKAPKTLRQWGYYRILHDVTGCKVKELTVEPGKSLSMQRHFKRNEYWLVTEGECKVEKEFSALFVRKHETVQIAKEQWHKLSNPFTEPCRLVEIQYGEDCIEDDIERIQ